MINKDKVCAIVISFNIGKKIDDCINAVINQVNHIIIVDNYSDESTIEKLVELHRNNKIDVIFNNTNYGIAKALNIGLNKAINKGYGWILTLDHDSIASKNMINNMLQMYRELEHLENIGIICANIYDINKKAYLIEDSNSQKDYKMLKVAMQSGSLIKSEVFKDVGLFNEELFIYYVDVEFSERVKEHNYKIIQSNPATLYHEEGKKIEKRVLCKKYYYDNYSKLAIYYIARNSIYMIKSYKKNKKSYIKRLIKDFKCILIFDQNRFIKLGYFFCGVLHGINNTYGKFEQSKCLNFKTKNKRRRIKNDSIR